MRYPEVDAAVAGITGEGGPFPLVTATVNGERRQVFGGLPEGVMYAILLMNAATPLIDRYTQPRVFGREAGSE